MFSDFERIWVKRGSCSRLLERRLQVKLGFVEKSKRLLCQLEAETGINLVDDLGFKLKSCEAERVKEESRRHFSKAKASEKDMRSVAELEWQSLRMDFARRLSTRAVAHEEKHCLGSGCKNQESWIITWQISREEMSKAKGVPFERRIWNSLDKSTGKEVGQKD